MARSPQDKAVAPVAAERVTDADVAAYLTRHPRFFIEHPDLFDLVSLPEPQSNGSVIDLRSVLVERLRGQLRSLSSAQDDLIATSRGNLASQARVHQAVLLLLSALSFEHLIELLTTDLSALIDVDVVSLGVEQKTEDLPPVRVGGLFQLEAGTVDRLLGKGKNLLLRADVAGDVMLYGSGQGLVRSDALVRLNISPTTPPALLSLGAREAGAFHPGQGTELLGFLGQVVERLIRGWLQLPA